MARSCAGLHEAFGYVWLGERVVVDERTGCWLWQKSKTEHGYPRVRLDYKEQYAHRAFYEHYREPIPKGLFACHTCDVNWPVGDITYRSCVNPWHLFLGTTQDNRDDCIAKGRHAHGLRNGAHTKPESVLRGSESGNAKLVEAGVMLMRYLRAWHGTSLETLGEWFGVNLRTTHRIVENTSWTHVPVVNGPFSEAQAPAAGRPLIDWSEQPLGRVPDAELARQLGVTSDIVEYARKRRSIPLFERRVDWSKEPRLGVVPDEQLATILGVPRKLVTKARKRRCAVAA